MTTRDKYRRPAPRPAGERLKTSAMIGEAWTEPVDRLRLFREESCGVFRWLELTVDWPGSKRGLWFADDDPTGLATGEGMD